MTLIYNAQLPETHCAVVASLQIKHICKGGLCKNAGEYTLCKIIMHKKSKIDFVRVCVCVLQKFVELWTNKTHITLPTNILEHKLKPAYSVYYILYWE